MRVTHFTHPDQLWGYLPEFSFYKLGRNDTHHMCYTSEKSNLLELWLMNDVQIRSVGRLGYLYRQLWAFRARRALRTGFCSSCWSVFAHRAALSVHRRVSLQLHPRCGLRSSGVLSDSVLLISEKWLHLCVCLWKALFVPSHKELLDSYASAQ